MILQTLVREVCRDHGVTEVEILRPRASMRVSQARKEIAQRLKLEHGWSYGQIARVLRCRRSAIQHALASPVKRDAEQRVEGLEATLRRYLGLDLAPEIAAKTGLSRSFSLWLSILVEAYPRTLSAERMLEQYEHAAEILRVETGDLSDNTVRVAVLRIRRHFAEVGLADPIETVASCGYRLAPDVVGWMAANFGKPASVVFAKSVQLGAVQHG